MTQPSWLDLTRPSASMRHRVPRVIDSRVRPGHDGWDNGGGWDGGDGRVEVRP